MILENIMRIFTFFGGFLGCLYCFNLLFSMPELTLGSIFDELNELIFRFLGMLIGSLATLLALKPNKPIPLHFVTIGVFGVLVYAFCTTLPSILIFIAAILGIITFIWSDKNDEEKNS